MTDDALLALPLLIPLSAAAICAMAWHRPRVQRGASLAAALGLLIGGVALLHRVMAAGPIATQFGDWPAPFGITFVADVFAAIMVLITGGMGLAIAVYGLADGAAARERAGFHPLYHGLLFGVAGAFLTGDIFNLYVWFEVMLIASFGLLVLGGGRAQIDGGIKYVCLNLVATSLFLIAVGLLYGVVGTLNMADLARKVPLVENQGLMAAIAVLFLICFGMKAAVFPLFFWLPAAYHTASIPVVAIFAAMLTKVGVYAIIRVFTLIFTGDVGYTSAIVAVVAGLTMITGVLGAAAHYDVRRILSFHIISQIGYMLIGVAVFTPLAIAGAVLYIVHHIVVKANLFLIAGAVRRVGGSFQLAELGGLFRSHPLLAFLFLVPALSLAGLPPLSGFWGKFVVVQASLEAGSYLLAAVALVVGLLTLFSMIKIWNEAFWKPAPAAEPGPPWTRAERAATLLPIAALAAITLAIGLWAEPFLAVSTMAAAQILNPEAYIAAVLGGAR